MFQPLFWFKFTTNMVIPFLSKYQIYLSPKLCIKTQRAFDLVSRKFYIHEEATCKVNLATLFARAELFPRL